VGRARINHRDQLHGYLVVGARQDDRAGIGEAERRGTRRDLLDGIDRALAAHDADFEICCLVVALVDGDEVVGMPTVEAGICYQAHLVLRQRRAAREQQPCR
jgi:hypothetical protein